SKAFSKINIEWNENYNIPSSVMGQLTESGFAKKSSLKEDAIQFLAQNKELFGINNPASELKLISSFTDDLNQTHLKFQQMYEDVIIYKGQIIVHISSDGRIIGVNGKYYPTPEFNTKPDITSLQAISAASGYMGAYKYNTPGTELFLLERGINFYLAYAVKLPSKDTPNMVIYIDASSGKIIYKDDGIRYDGPQVGTGIDLKNQTRQINTYLLSGKYYLVNAALPMYVPPFDSLKGVIDVYDAMNDTSGGGYNSAVLITDPNNDNNFNDNTRLKAAVSAHLYVRDAYLFYKSHFNRTSFDNAGHSMINVVHYMQSYNNAFWNGVCMSYGDGDNVKFSNLAGAFDVIVHELTHAVTERTANLVYENQPGALNESMSDVFASCADSTNWLIGEDVYTPGISGDALRNMLFPHNNSTQGSNSWQPESMDEFVTLPNTQEGDYGGVHVNSGITNRAFALTAESITRWKAGQIWYRALLVYLTNNSGFYDARVACQNAAKDLYGDNSAEQNAVSTAFETVGITSNTGQTYELTYDDGNPLTGVYEPDANWELAVKFTAPTNNIKITKCQLYIAGDNNSSGNGSFTLKMYNTGSGGLPNQSLITPYPHTPATTGWQIFNVSGVTVNTDFFISAKYDGTNRPYIGAATPPGNGRAYESNGIAWAQLTSPNDYTLYMRATVQAITGVYEISTKTPSNFEISQNYPNPFNPTTSITYALPKAEYVTMYVYDITGKQVAELVNNNQNPGTYTVTWNGKNSNGNVVSSGIYFYKIKAGNYTKTFKMNLIK
ncbi:MAG: M4 family metallopeptidase, partial [Bacteroidota bacterium]|nr:M4 family metallopeptidase [Bacteroidota bacterium]